MEVSVDLSKSAVIKVSFGSLECKAEFLLTILLPLRENHFYLPHQKHREEKRILPESAKLELLRLTLKSKA